VETSKFLCMQNKQFSFKQSPKCFRLRRARMFAFTKKESPDGHTVLCETQGSCSIIRKCVVVSGFQPNYMSVGGGGGEFNLPTSAVTTYSVFAFFVKN
jgi:hypothetical protein